MSKINWWRSIVDSTRFSSRRSNLVQATFFFTDLIQDLVLFATNLGKPGLSLFDTPRKPFSLLVSLTELVLKAGDFTSDRIPSLRRALRSRHHPL
jgi:hypothetical protein